MNSTNFSLASTQAKVALALGAGLGWYFLIHKNKKAIVGVGGLGTVALAAVGVYIANKMGTSSMMAVAPATAVAAPVNPNA